MTKSVIVLLILSVSLVKSLNIPDDRASMYGVDRKGSVGWYPEEQTEAFWKNAAEHTLKGKIRKNVNDKIAENVILVVGDGMSLSTITATRPYLKDENYQLSFEKFEHTGLSKTYCVDAQVADSGCTATALLNGIKSNAGTLGVTAKVKYNDCASYSPFERVHSIVKYAQDKGKATGVVTTNRVTRDIAAATYANTPSRNWENSNNITGNCMDIATQLVRGGVGKKLNVVLGGGKREFLPESDGGIRKDKRNLLNKWVTDHSLLGETVYINNWESLMNMKLNNVDYLLGLFSDSHLRFRERFEGFSGQEPTLTEMTMKAMDLLERKGREKENKGYMLIVEGGNIELAHHQNRAKVALKETAELDRTVKAIMKRVNTENTLVIVTSDHSNTMTISGYPPRGANILGTTGNIAKDNKPYFTLSYANGNSYYNHHKTNGERKNPDQMTPNTRFFEHPAMIPLKSNTHGGDDVAVFATGPQSHIFSGAYEQNYIAHAVKYAACLGNDPELSACFSPIHGAQ